MKICLRILLACSLLYLAALADLQAQDERDRLNIPQEYRVLPIHFSAEFERALRVALWPRVNAALNATQIVRREGAFTIVKVSGDSVDPSRADLKWFIDTQILSPLLQATAYHLGYPNVEALGPNPPIIWPFTQQALDRILLYRSPFTVEESEHAADQDLRFVLNRWGLELPDLQYLVDESSTTSAPVKLVLVQPQVDGVATTTDKLPFSELIDLYAVMRPYHDEGNLEKCSDHVKHTYAAIEFELKSDLVSGYKAYQTGQATEATPRVHRYRNEGWFPEEVAAVQLSLWGEELSQERYQFYQQDEAYREMMQGMYPEVARSFDQHLSEVRDLNQQAVSLAIDFINGTLDKTEAANFEREVEATYGVPFRFSNVTGEKLEALQAIVEDLQNGFGYYIPMPRLRLYSPKHKPLFSVPPITDPNFDYFIKIGRGSMHKRQAFPAVDILLKPTQLNKGIDRQTGWESAYGRSMGGTRWHDFGENRVFGDKSPILFSATAYGSLLENHDRIVDATIEQIEESNENAVKVTLIVAAPVAIAVGGYVLVAGGGITAAGGSLSLRAAGSLALRGALLHEAGVVVVSVARSVHQRRVVLPSIENVTIDPLQTGLMFGVGGFVGGGVRALIPRIRPLLADTLGVASVGFAYPLIRGESVPHAAVNAVKVGSYTLFGGFSDLLATVPLRALSGGFRVYVANAVVSGAGAGVEYKLAGYSDMLGIPAESLFEAIAYGAIESAPGDLHSVRAVARAENIVLPAKERQDYVEKVNSSGLGKEEVYDKIIRAREVEVEDPATGEKSATVGLHHVDGLMPEGAKASLVMLHGLGSKDVSRAESVRSWIRLFTGSGEGASKSSPVKKLRKHKNFTPVGSEAIDLPGHGSGPPLKDLQSLNEAADWLASYLKKKKEAHADKPLIVMARSASPIIVAAVNAKYPELIDALVFISPSLPGYPEVMRKEMAAIEEDVEKGLYTVDEELMKWIDGLQLSASWDGEDFNFGDKPVLIFTGANDTQMPEESRTFYRELAVHDNITYEELPASDHFILSGANQAAKKDDLKAAKMIEDLFADLTSE